MRGLLPLCICLTLPFCLQGCFNTSELLPVGTSFVVQGTMTATGRGCLVWEGNNGVSYYLYQDPLLDNGLFDQIITPGTTSRLVIATRSDLTAPCITDAVVQVQEVLEIIQ